MLDLIAVCLEKLPLPRIRAQVCPVEAMILNGWVPRWDPNLSRIPGFCMWETQLIDANLKGASLINADIGRSKFTGPDVTDANFSGVRCDISYTGLEEAWATQGVNK
jgi:hypothetical protein